MYFFIGVVIGLVLVAAAVALITLPLMLFLGNLGLNLSFWGCVPGALTLGLIGGSGSLNSKKS